MTSTASNLRARLQSQMEADRQQITEALRSELQQLGEQSKLIVRDELRTINAVTTSTAATIRDELHALETATAESCARTHALLRLKWLWFAAMGLMVLLGICGGSWATLQWLSTRVQNELELLVTLREEIAASERTLSRLEETTWGVTLRELENGRFVVLPAGTRVPSPPWTVGGRPAVRLSSE